MIAFNDVFSWLNYGELSHLTAPNQLSLIQIEDPKIPLNHREAIKKRSGYLANLAVTSRKRWK